MEARAGIEPAIELLQSPALPLGYPASQRTRHLRAQRPPFKFLVKQESLLACKTPKRSDKKIGDDIRFVYTHEPFIQPVLPDRQAGTVEAKQMQQGGMPFRDTHGFLHRF